MAQYMSFPENLLQTAHLSPPGSALEGALLCRGVTEKWWGTLQRCAALQSGSYCSARKLPLFLLPGIALLQLPAQARSSAAQQYEQRYAFGLIRARHCYRCLPMPGTGWTH